MEASRTPKRWTYDEFARLPSETSTRHEIIAGELVVTPSPGTRHQRIVLKLITLLASFVDSNDLGWIVPGPVDVLFAEGDYLAPDLVFVREQRRAIISERGLEGPPDLVVEILSPATAARDRGLKRERYAHYGVPEYWIVDPDERVIERWRFAIDDTAPETARDALRWQPVPVGPVLEVPVQEITAGFDA